MRATDELHAELTERLVADPTACTGSLDVWLIATDGGIYVQARDRLGRLRERVVSDADVAATLIASWVEVDTAAPLWIAPPAAAPVAAAPIEAAPPVAAPPTAVVPAVAVAPSRPSLAPVVVAYEAPLPSRHQGRSMSLSGFYAFTGTGMDGGGVRAAVDALARGRWRFGVAVQATAFDASDRWHGHPNDESLSVNERSRRSADLLLTTGYVLQRGRLSLVPSVGLGVGIANHELDIVGESDIYSYWVSGTTIGPRGEAMLAARLALTARWTVELAASTGADVFWQDDDTYDPVPVLAEGRNMAMLGLRYQP